MAITTKSTPRNGRRIAPTATNGMPNLPIPNRVQLPPDNARDLTPWQDRWNNVRYAIELVGQTLPSAASTSPYFRCLLGNLSSFVQRQVDYFARPLESESEYALNITLNQASFDLAAITCAANQRKVDEFRLVLEKADKIAELFIATIPCGNTGLFQDTSGTPATKENRREPKPIVLTYFQKTKTIRVMPYSSVMLVGIPYTALMSNTERNLQAALDLISVAHEVGHLVFWKGFGEDYARNNSAKFSRFLNLQLRSDGLSPWTGDGAEQLIADTYTACVAGPAAAIAAQDKAIARQLDRNFAEDQRYQIVPEARPQIYLNTIKSYPLLKVNFPDIKDLENRWQRNRTILLDELSESKMVRPYSNSALVGLNTVERELKDANTYVNRFLKDIDLPPLLKAKYTDVHSLMSGADLALIGLNAWVQFVESLDIVNEPAIPNRADNNESKAKATLGRFYVANEVSLVGYWNSGNWALWAELLMDEEMQWPVSDYYPEWDAILYARGWTLESPSNTGPPKI